MGESTTWTVVKFGTDDSVSAIPTKWIYNDKCLWPPFPSEKVSNAIRHQHIDTCWPSYDIDIFRNATYDNYETARAKAPKAEYTSEAESTTKKRKIIRRRLSSSSSDEDPISEDILVKSPPKLYPNPCNIGGDKNKPSKKPHFLKGNNLENMDLQPVQPETDLGPTPHRFSTSTPTRVLDRVLTAPSNDGSISTASSQANLVELPLTQMSGNTEPCNCCPHHVKYFRAVLKSQTLIRSLLTDLLEEVGKRNTPNSVTAVEGQNSVLEAFTLPVNSIEDFASLNKFLEAEEIFNQAVCEIRKVGGTTNFEFVKRVLGLLITNQLAINFSFLGRRDKRKFKELEVAKLIIVAADQAKVANSWKETETSISQWLRRAKDRIKSATTQNN